MKNVFLVDKISLRVFIYDVATCDVHYIYIYKKINNRRAYFIYLAIHVNIKYNYELFKKRKEFI